MIGLLFGIFAALIAVVFLIYRVYFVNLSRNRKVIAFLRNPDAYQNLVSPALLRCGDVPFIMPTSGLIGFLWGDLFQPGHHH